MNNTAEALLTRKDVEQLSGLSRSSIYRLMHLRKFPAPLKVSYSAVRWKQSDITDWQSNLAKTCA